MNSYQLSVRRVKITHQVSLSYKRLLHTIEIYLMYVLCFTPYTSYTILPNVVAYSGRGTKFSRCRPTPKPAVQHLSANMSRIVLRDL